MSLISLMITPSCRVFAREAPSCCEAAMPFRLRRGGSSHLPFLCSRYMTVAILTPGTAARDERRPPFSSASGVWFWPSPSSLSLHPPHLTRQFLSPFTFPSSLTHPLTATPSPPPHLPPHSRQLYYEKYTVSIECPSDIFDLLASFRTVFNQPP